MEARLCDSRIAIIQREYQRSPCLPITSKGEQAPLSKTPAMTAVTGATITARLKGRGSAPANHHEKRRLLGGQKLVALGGELGEGRHGVLLLGAETTVDLHAQSTVSEGCQDSIPFFRLIGTEIITRLIADKGGVALGFKFGDQVAIVFTRRLQAVGIALRREVTKAATDQVIEVGVQLIEGTLILMSTTHVVGRKGGGGGMGDAGRGGQSHGITGIPCRLGDGFDFVPSVSFETRPLVILNPVARAVPPAAESVIMVLLEWVVSNAEVGKLFISNLASGFLVSIL